MHASALLHRPCKLICFAACYALVCLASCHRGIAHLAIVSLCNLHTLSCEQAPLYHADSDATMFLSDTEVMRARIALCGYCISAAL